MQKNLVSIMILAFNNLHYTKQCLDSVFDYTSQVKSPFEVIVVDNASTDGTVEYLRGIEKSGMIRAVYNKDNRGFPGGMNDAAKIAQGEYLCLLNNDTIVTASWLEKLLRCIRSDSKVAIVGPYCNALSGVNASPVPCTYTGTEELQKFAEKFSQEDKYTDFLVFFCAMIKRTVWDEIGGLDEDLNPGNFDDNLFCWQTVEKGYKLKVAGNAFVHHWIGKSFGYNSPDKKKQDEYSRIMARNQRIFLKKIGRYKTVSLCMIISDQEKPETFERALDSVAQWVDEVNIVFNYIGFPKNSNFAKLRNIQRDFGRELEHNWRYVKWTNFSDMRNQSLDMATGDYCIWLDADDVLLHPAGIRDVILNNPDIDVFRFQLRSRTELGTEEMIYHTNLFKNKKEYRFRGRVHEDILPSMNESGAKLTTTNITIQHLGYLNLKTWKEKNLRNYKLLLLDLQDNPHSLTYYHVVNCLLIIGGHENMLQAVKYVDECLEKFPMDNKDPLLPKMWVLRGVACMDAKQDLAAKQSFHKAYDEWKHPEAAVNLAELYLREKNHDKVLEVLNPIYALKEFQLSNIPMDVIQAECMMLQKMGEAYYQKHLIDGKMEHLQQAERLFREHLTVRDNLMVIDRLCQILRNTGRQDEAAFLTRNAVNKFQGYFIGFSNLGAYEIDKKCFVTAKLFLRECLRLKPGHPEALHNLKMIEKMEGGSHARKP